MKLYDANLVAGVIGLPQDEMDVVQHALDHGEHWEHLDGHTWVLTGSGVMAALDAFDIDQDKLPDTFWPDIEGCLLKKNPPPKMVEVVFVKLSKNIRVVICTLDGQRIRLLVHGNRNKNFIRGMKIPATHLEGDLYRINGPSPKRRGRLR